MNIGISAPRRVTDPDAPRLRLGVAFVVFVASGAIATGLVTGGRSGELAVLGGALTLAELFSVRLTDGSELPTSYAIALPLGVVAHPGEFVAIVLAAQAIAAIARRGRSLRERIRVGAHRALGACVGYGTYRLAGWALGPGALARMGALGLGAVAMFVIESVARRRRGSEPFHVTGGQAAAFAVGASGILMALALDGPGDSRAMGLWGLPIFAVPMLSARWAFDRLHAIRRTYDQTIEVLSMVPEMSGRIRPGHARRIANLAVDMGRELGLGRRRLADLERAALLYSVGHVTLDSTEDAADPAVSLGRVGEATAQMLASENHLEGPTGIVARSVAMDDRPPLGRDELLSAEVLRVATAFEQTAGGDPLRAQAALEFVARSAGGVDDRRIVAALEASVLRRVRAAI